MYAGSPPGRPVDKAFGATNLLAVCGRLPRTSGQASRTRTSDDLFDVSFGQCRLGGITAGQCCLEFLRSCAPQGLGKGFLSPLPDGVLVVNKDNVLFSRQGGYDYVVSHKSPKCRGRNHLSDCFDQLDASELYRLQFGFAVTGQPQLETLEFEGA